MPTPPLVLTVTLDIMCQLDSVTFLHCCHCFPTVITSVCVGGGSIYQPYQLMAIMMASEGGFLFPSFHLHLLVGTHWEEELSPGIP